ncbi:3292_t:CDS:2, partial [Racocetra fulgida]
PRPPKNYSPPSKYSPPSNTSSNSNAPRPPKNYSPQNTNSDPQNNSSSLQPAVQAPTYVGGNKGDRLLQKEDRCCITNSTNSTTSAVPGNATDAVNKAANDGSSQCKAICQKLIYQALYYG